MFVILHRHLINHRTKIENKVERQGENLKEKCRAMKVGDIIEVAIERAAIIRNYAYELSLLTAAKYTTAIDKERRVVAITRVE